MGNTTGAEHTGEMIQARIIVRDRQKAIKTMFAKPIKVVEGGVFVDLSEILPLKLGDTLTIVFPSDEPKIVEGGAKMTGEGGFRG